MSYGCRDSSLLVYLQCASVTDRTPRPAPPRLASSRSKTQSAGTPSLCNPYVSNARSHDRTLKNYRNGPARPSAVRLYTDCFMNACSSYLVF